MGGELGKDSYLGVAAVTVQAEKRTFIGAEILGPNGGDSWFYMSMRAGKTQSDPVFFPLRLKKGMERTESERFVRIGKGGKDFVQTIMGPRKGSSIQPE